MQPQSEVRTMATRPPTPELGCWRAAVGPGRAPAYRRAWAHKSRPPGGWEAATQMPAHQEKARSRRVRLKTWVHFGADGAGGDKRQLPWPGHQRGQLPLSGGLCCSRMLSACVCRRWPARLQALARIGGSAGRETQ